MFFLPSEQKEIKEAILRSLEEEGRAFMYEPCNCGSHIRHNNGGNYHEIINFVKEDNKYYVRFTSTSEFDGPGRWEKVDIEKIKSIIDDRLEKW